MAEPVPSVRWMWRSRSPSRSAIAIGSSPAIAAWERSIVVLAYGSVEGSQPGRYISMPRRDEARHGYMFSTANAMPVDSSSAAMPLTKSRAYSFCQRNGGCTTTTSAPTADAISAERSSLPHGSVPQTRWVNSRHGAWIAETGMLVVLGELLDRGDRLRERVDDHHLDGVVAEARGVPEGVRGRLGVDRGGGEADPRSRDPSTDSWSSRSRITPSRSAHGQISSSVRSKMSMQPSATSAPGTIWWVRLGETPGRSASSSGAIATSLGIHSRSCVERQRARHQRAVGRRRRTADAAQRAERLRGRRRPVRRPAAQQVARRRGRSRRGSRGAARARSPRRRCRPRKWVRASRAAPSGSDQATSGASSAPPAISSEPPPMSKTASRPADQPNQRRTARKVSRASSSPESTSITTPVRSCTCSRTSSLLPASRTAEVAKPRMSSQPLSSATRSASAVNVGQRVDPGLRDVAGLVEVLGEPQRLLEGVRRQRCGAAVGVHHEQVSGVGADVQHAHAHGSNVLGGRADRPSLR